MPAHYLPADHIMVRAEIGPVPAGQRQVGGIADSELVSLGRLGLMEQSVRGAAQSVRRVGVAGREGLWLQRVQAPSAHGPAQALPTDAVALAA